MIDYDQEVRLHHAAFRRALSIAPTDRVLDIGCGAGQTTREAAATASSVLGVDCSAPMIERARAHGVHNVRYVCADVEHHAFDQTFELAISRFGTMFFKNPAAAFQNIRRALTTHARLSMLVWQRREDNEWAVELQRAAAAAEHSAFSLGDPDHVRPLLTAAGFADATFEEVHAPVFYGHDPESAFAFVSQFSFVRDAPHSEARLRQVLAAHHSQTGVWFDARSWIVTARSA